MPGVIGHQPPSRCWIVPIYIYIYGIYKLDIYCYVAKVRWRIEQTTTTFPQWVVVVVVFQRLRRDDVQLEFMAKWLEFIGTRIRIYETHIETHFQTRRTRIWMNRWEHVFHPKNKRTPIVSAGSTCFVARHNAWFFNWMSL